MAKITFTKLGLTKNQDVKVVNLNGQDIEVKQYLPVNDKLTLIGNIINSAQDGNNFYNYGKLQVFFVLEVIFNYTNISFTDKQKEDPCKLYDLFNGTGEYGIIYNSIPEAETTFLWDVLMESVKSIYSYNNSVMGILDNVSRDYSNLSLDASEIQQKIADPENLQLLRTILTKLG